MRCGRGRLLLVATLMVAAGAAAVSCLQRPDLNELLSKPVIVTKRDLNADFGSLTTFAMTDSIPVASSLDGGSLDAGASVTTVDPAIANPTLDEISAQFVSRGYERVTRTEGPDFGVAVTAVTKLNAVTVNYGGWWGAGAASGSYWGYSGSGLGSTIGYSSVVVWQSGTLIIELYDLRAARDEARRTGVVPTLAASTTPTTTVPIPVIWGALLHGVLGGAGATLEAPPIAAIQQAFIQSPYLARSSTPLEVP
jgi:hypothetical protein